jgi:LysR family transcriptional regulator, nod-box dependent transcriptional activator
MAAKEENLRKLNLNLLPVLSAILRQRNLTRAAEELHVTQTAVSNSLKLLRGYFGDELLVRQGRALQLTKFAKSVLPKLDDAMQAISHVFSRVPFDPASSHQTFRVATADYVMAILAPELAVIQSTEAPRVTVQMLAARRQSGEDVRVGRVDMIVTPRRVLEHELVDNAQLRAELSTEHLLTEPLVCVGHRDDIELRRGLTAKRYLNRAHAGFVLDLDMHGSVEQFHLGDIAASQFERILTSSFCVLPSIVASSKCLALLPKSLAAMAVRTYPVIAVCPPVNIPPIELILVWHRRNDREESIRWLRNALHKCAALALGAASGGG